MKRVRKSEVLGTRNQFPTKRLALRVFEEKLTAINDPTYRAASTILFRDFAEKWQKTVLAQHDTSTQKADRSRLRVHLIPALGDTMLMDINAQRLQDFIAHSTSSPKSVKNKITLLRTMWNSAKAWGHFRHDPFDGLVLRKPDQQEQPISASIRYEASSPRLRNPMIFACGRCGRPGSGGARYAHWMCITSTFRMLPS